MATKISRIFFTSELEEAEDCDIFALAVDVAVDVKPQVTVTVAY